MLQQIGEKPPTLSRETGLKETDPRPEAPGKSPKARFTVVGEEMIEKEVKAGGNAGRVYLPMGWVGKLVKIIRID